MHSERLGLGGPIWWFGLVILGGAWLFAAFILIDQVRRLRRDFTDIKPVPRAIYLSFSAFYFVAAIVAQIQALRQLALVVVLSAPVMIVIGIVYLLRVVYPLPPKEQR